jgi:hypothetical protein
VNPLPRADASRFEPQWHGPSRAWFGEVYPGTVAPVIDVEGVEGKIAGVDAIQAHDPAFSEAAFLVAVERVFFAVLEAWTTLRPSLAQGVMAAAIFQQLRTQVLDYQGRGRRNLLEGLRLVSANVAGARSQGGIDTLTVRINAESSDYDVEAASGRILEGDQQLREWTEDWIFQRPSSLSTATPGTVAALTCPACGAAVTVDVTSICPFCGAAVVSGRFGWLLTRIERVL